MALNEYYEFYHPTKVMFGQGLTEDVGAGLVDAIKASIENSNVDLIQVFSDVPVNSEVDVCRKVAEIGKANLVDLLISVGGGSVIDTAKGANILLGVGGDLM